MVLEYLNVKSNILNHHFVMYLTESCNVLQTNINPLTITGSLVVSVWYLYKREENCHLNNQGDYKGS